jgi:hypothetical protein
MFENRGVRRIIGLKREAVLGGWRKVRNEELRYLYCSAADVIRAIE